MNKEYIELKIWFLECDHLVYSDYSRDFSGLRFASAEDLLYFRDRIVELSSPYDVSQILSCVPSVQEAESSPDRGLAQRVLSDDPV